MKKTRKLEIAEFSQYINDKVETLEGRFKGLHIVVNALADELRQHDPELAAKIADKISDWALGSAPTEHVEEIVKIYHQVLKFGKEAESKKLQ